ncbi:MAG: TM0106 family RecB-like putative nuclease [Gemmatimonadota bacterium]|nr:TM0106 family RecB-like putative nuclease [Gemmatimonadota bacterium]
MQSEVRSFSPSHLNDFLECEHLVALNIAVSSGALARPNIDDPQADLIRRKGEAHEQAYLTKLQAEGKSVLVVETEDRDWQRAARVTADAIRTGSHDVVYQGVFIDPDGWRGIADFVERQVDGAFEVSDTKLARHSKPYFLLQLSFYSEELGRIQGHLPERMHVVLGTDDRESFRVADFIAYYRRVRARFLEFVANPGETYPHPVAHCEVCTWRTACERRWTDDDHLSLVANMRRSWIARLGEAGITSVAELALGQEQTIDGIRPEIFDRLRDQARMQYEGRTDGHKWKLLEVAAERGLALLPRPSAGDVFYDIEGDPFYEAARGLEYLHGVITNGEFRTFWARSRDEEQRAFEQVVDFLTEQLLTYPDMHVYHYAHYEVAVLRRLAAEYGTREDDVDELLRREVFVDLYRVVAQSVRISHHRYGLKQVETFFMPARTEDVTAGDDSILVFEQWLDTGDDALLGAIERYNEFDCRATEKLRDWLLERRGEAGVETWKELEDPRQVPIEKVESIAEREAFRRSLLEGTEVADERWLIAQLLEYHRREDRPVWWHFFRRLEATEEELRDWDSEAIAGLEAVGDPEDVKASRVYTLRFPTQQYKLGPGDVVDPATGNRERIVEIDEERELVRIARGRKRDDETLPSALIPGGPWITKAQRAALARLASEVLSPQGRYRALRGILRRDPPLAGETVHTNDLEELKQLVSRLHDNHLFIQGPPGSGKTWTGARLIVHLMREGRRVGICAPGHKAIHRLLDEVESVARAEAFVFRGIKRGDDEQSTYVGRCVTTSNDIGACLDPEVQLVAGTAWLHAREEMDSTLDYLFVDEAGQVSLADALAVGTAANAIVFLGDPLQLAQVSQGVHPGGTGSSVLEHLLGEAATIPPERGVFLERTWRMHPAVCSFVSEVVYDNRLEPAPGRERQSIEGVGAGLRYVGVEHEERSQSAPEEAEAIAAEIERLIGRSFTDADGGVRSLGYRDVLVVAPYNQQVRCLRNVLAADVRVGTVDKFQGQEAPIVFYSTTSSSADEVPRGLGFLFSRNRLNVAISRAQCLAVLVGSPRLLDVRPRSVDQMRLVNALCRFVEMAEGEDMSPMAALSMYPRPLPKV